MRHVSDDERRARIATRHALAPSARRESVSEIVEAMTVLHATEPASVHLACRARGRDVTLADVDRALYAQRGVVKQLAMRRTLFAFPRDLLTAAWGSASRRAAAAEGGRMARDLAAAGIAADGSRWLRRARAAVLAELAEHPSGLTAGELRARVPRIDVTVTVAPSTRWTASRILVYLGARGDILRGANTGGWRTARPRWTLARHWLGDGEDLRPARAADGYRELVRRWLWTFGPGTEDDIVWWLGSTRTAVRTALGQLGAVEVSLDGGVRGWLAADDLPEAGDPGPWVALLPVLDPTTMGWRERAFHLGPHRAQLFDAQGNGGTTAWVDGRIVGCWVQDGAGTVRLRLLERVGAGARRALEEEAARLTAWLGGERLRSAWRSPAMGPRDDGG